MFLLSFKHNQEFTSKCLLTSCALRLLFVEIKSNFTLKDGVCFLRLNSSYLIKKCNFFLQFLISYTTKIWLQSALQHTDTWMNHIFSPSRKTVMRDSRSFKLDSNRRRSSMRGVFLWYHLHREQKRLPSTAWWILWQKLLATSFLLRQFHRPPRTACLSNNTMMDRYDKSPMIIWGDICKGTPALYLNGLLFFVLISCTKHRCLPSLSSRSEILLIS